MQANLPINNTLFQKALYVVKTLIKNKFETYLAGGCVRDLIMGLRPKDYDVATVANPSEVMKIFKKSIPVGIMFGVVRVRISGHEFEVATFRKDGLYIDGRRPQSVNFSTPQEDVNRRDFTINGLLLNPETGEILDYVGGLEDIRANLIRAIGNPFERFKEDRLRMIRAIRFAAHFAYTIESSTWKAVKSQASKITMVSAERLRDEFSKILTGHNPDEGIRLLNESGILYLLVPEFKKEQIQKIIKFFKDFKTSDISIAMALILFFLPEDTVFTVLKRLKFENKIIKEVTYILNKLKIVEHFQEMMIHEKKKLLRESLFNKLFSFIKIIIDSGFFDKETFSSIKDSMSVWNSSDLNPPRLITGNDLQDMGIKPGPLYSKILTKIENAQLEGKINSREDAIDFVKTMILEFNHE